jgi:type IV pilus assembly protein PilW
MTRSFARSPKRFNQGLSLIELMVSLTIGLILMIAVISAYLGSAGAGRMAEAQGRMNEDANAALTILAQQLRMAGNNPKKPNYTDVPPVNPVYGTSTFTVRGCEGGFSDVATAASIPALTCAGGASSSPDAVAISYEADRYNTVPLASGAPSDCLGQELKEPNVALFTANRSISNGVTSTGQVVTYTVADNRYYVATSPPSVIPSLYCRGNGGTGANSLGQPLVENVEDLQLTYGTALSNATATLAVAGYLDAANVTTEASLALLATDQSRWSKVVTVRVCIVVRSEALVAPSLASARYTKCNGDLENSPPDLHLRRAYSTTVVLRNRLTL